MQTLTPSPSLVDRLRFAAEAWTTACNATPAKLGRVVVNHSGFFSDLDKMSRGPSTDTLEKFARYLIDPVNWPEGKVAQEAVDLAHVVGVTPEAAPASAIKAGANSPIGAVTGGVA